MHFPFIEQPDSMRCGITCLRMICKYYGQDYSLDILSKICFATTEGVSMFGLNEAAKGLGFQKQNARVSIERMQQMPLPCILHWNQNHFVVLYKIKKGKTYYVADPGKGLVRYNLEEFKKHWISTKSDGEEKGIAMFLEPTPDFYKKHLEEGNIKEQRSFKFVLRM